jgi:hypothetical protein
MTALVAGCAPPPKLPPLAAFGDTKRLETQLARGVSTTQDIRRVLGPPTGKGGMLLPRVEGTSQEFWFYQDIELTDMKATQGQLDLVIRQQVMLIMVRNGLFDGFMWFSNTDAATAWVRDSLRGKIQVP